MYIIRVDNLNLFNSEHLRNLNLITTLVGFLMSCHGHLLISRVYDHLLISKMRGVDQKPELGRRTMAVIYLPTAAIPPGGRLDSLIHLPLQ